MLVYVIFDVGCILNYMKYQGTLGSAAVEVQKTEERIASVNSLFLPDHKRSVEIGGKNCKCWRKYAEKKADNAV